MDTIELIKSVGFPVAVAFVLLWRLDRTMVRLEVEIARLAEQVEMLVHAAVGVKSQPPESPQGSASPNDPSSP